MVTERWSTLRRFTATSSVPILSSIQVLCSPVTAARYLFRDKDLYLGLPPSGSSIPPPRSAPPHMGTPGKATQYSILSVPAFQNSSLAACDLSLYGRPAPCQYQRVNGQNSSHELPATKTSDPSSLPEQSFWKQGRHFWVRAQVATPPTSPNTPSPKSKLPGPA